MAQTKPKRIRKPRAKGPPCANCDTVLVGAWCHACGQKAHLHNKLKQLVEELAEGIAHFDGRMWRTLPLLALNPGRLSREWMGGRRVRYVAPLHLFLFAVFLLFLIPNFTGRHMFDFQSPARNGEGLSFTLTEDDGSQRVVDPADPAALKALNLPPPVVALVKMGVKLRENPQYYGYKFETLAYKLSFVTVPISVLILWPMFAWRRRFSLYHHAVVSLYGLGFVALLAAVAGVFPSPVSGALYTAIGLVAPVHAAAHLKGAYDSSWLAAILRTVVLGVLTLAAFGLFLIGVVLLGLAG